MIKDDTISRQSALNLIRSLTRWCVMSQDGKFNNVGLLYDDVMFGLDSLPSANPEENKLELTQADKCKNCPHYVLQGDICKLAYTGVWHEVDCDKRKFRDIDFGYSGGV